MALEMSSNCRFEQLFELEQELHAVGDGGAAPRGERAARGVDGLADLSGAWKAASC